MRRCSDRRSDVKILDSNIWIKGTLRTNSNAVRWLDRVERGVTSTVLDDYILAETLTAFRRELSGRTYDVVVNLFLKRLRTMEGIRSRPNWHTGRPTQQSTILSSRRNRIEIETLATVLGIQRKDVPIITLAYQHRDQQPEILTNDRSLSEFDPSAHSLPMIGMGYVHGP